MKFALGVDFDTEAICWAKENNSTEDSAFIEDDFWGRIIEAGCLLIAICPRRGYDAVISIDVIEHISKEQED